MNKQNLNISFSVGEKNDALPFVDRKIYIWKMEYLPPLSTGKKYSVMLIQILPVLFHLNTSLGYYTPF